MAAPHVFLVFFSLFLLFCFLTFVGGADRPEALIGINGTNLVLKSLPGSNGSVLLNGLDFVAQAEAIISSTGDLGDGVSKLLDSSIPNVVSQLEITKNEMADSFADINTRIKNLKSLLATATTTTTTTTTTKTTSPTTTTPAATAVPNYILVSGGGSTSASFSTTYAYNFSSPTLNAYWNTSMPNMTRIRDHSPAIVTVGPKVFAMGGYYSPNILSSVESLDIEGGSVWSSLPNMATPREYFDAVYIPWLSAIAVIGGHTSTTCASSCESFNASLSTWGSFPSLNSARCAHRVVLFEGSVFVLGGQSSSSGAPLSTVFALNLTLSNGPWMSLPSFSTPRSYFGAAVVAGKIYIAGGKSGGLSISSIEAYGGGTWTALNTTLPSPRMDCIAVSFRNSLVVIGGTAGSTTLAEVIVYFPSNATLSTLASMPTARASMGATVV